MVVKVNDVVRVIMLVVVVGMVVRRVTVVIVVWIGAVLIQK